MRYRIKYGRFGAYFYDSDKNRDIDLNEALKMLNKLDNIEHYRERSEEDG